uniref:C-type lectin domain-containing protein n=1 Tax=Seriola lalandi dorsalis TaxID=1841481 RepID=A0A3B4YIN4_SERLL
MLPPCHQAKIIAFLPTINLYHLLSSQQNRVFLGFPVNDSDVFSTEGTASCPGDQKAFGGSCYEFVGHRHSFFSAQAWCEESGGHLAFIPDEETQHFLQRHLDPEKDTWLGLAPPSSPKLSYSATVDGAACGHILKDSGFQWDATTDCYKKLHFICQFGTY